jgi:hypothetical protein
MAFWKKLLITLVAMVAASFIAGLIWKSVFDADLPSYIAGLIGGLSALPVWELLGRIQPRGSR